MGTAAADIGYQWAEWVVSLIPEMPLLALPDLSGVITAINALFVYLVPMADVKWAFAFWLASEVTKLGMGIVEWWLRIRTAAVSVG